ncbi:hypothetical protein [Streptomyces altiplanensis]
MNSSAALVAALVGLVTLGPVPSASAAAGTCADNYENAIAGYMYAYDGSYCDGTMLGRALGDDSNWGDSASSFQGGDNNKASSVLNKGNYQVVQFFEVTNGPGPNGFIYSTCLTRSEGYASTLSDEYWSDDRLFGTVNNNISSHRWVAGTTCTGYLQ